MKASKKSFISIKSFNEPARAMMAILLTAILLTSCAPSLTKNQPAPQPVQGSTPAVINGQMSAAIAAAKSALAKQLQLGVDTIQLANIQQIQWPDGCLGVQQPGIMCAMHVVDGYRITLSTNDQAYEVRSNLDGSQTVVVPRKESLSAPVKTDSAGLQITDFSSSIGGVDGNPEQEAISYNVTINNPSNNTVTVLWLEPVLKDSISGRVSDTNLQHAVNEVVGPNSQVDIHGQLTLNTGGLTKSDITQSGSLFSGFMISTNQTIPLP